MNLRITVKSPRMRTVTQEMYARLLRAETPPIVVAQGPAGTGKSRIATAIGLERLVDGEFDRMIITRPVVPADEEIGYLPGTLRDKMMPWLHPITDAMRDVGLSAADVDRMFERGVVEVAPLAFMRGRTFSNAWIVADEAQNCTTNQLLMLMTRIGHGSKMVVAGDVMQHDRGGEECGFRALVERLRDDENEEYADHVGLVEFSSHDVVRHPSIPKIIRLIQ
jgi:phosphate starvation-inducible PhoH-like protein